MKKLLITAILFLLGASWVTTIQTAVEEPAKYKAYLKTAAEYEKQQIYYDAILAYRGALEYKPKNMEIYLKMAQAYKALGNEAGFEETCRKAAALSERNEEAVFMLTDYYVEKGRKEEAITYLRLEMENKKNKEAIKTKLQSLAGGYNWIGGDYDVISNTCSGYMFMKSGEKYGLLNAMGQEVIRCRYDAVGLFGENGFAPVNEDGNWFFVDQNNYKRRVPDEEYEFLGVWNQGMIPACKNGRWGYLDKNLHEKCEFIYEETTPFLSDLAAVKKDGKWAVLNKNLEPVTEFGFDDIARDEWGFCSRNGVIFAKVGEAYVLLNSDGVQIGNETYEKVFPFLNDQPAAVRQAGKWGFVSTDGKKILENTFDGAKSFSRIGYAPVKIGDLWGYIKSNGDFLIEPEFENAKTFNKNGLAPVKMGGTWKLIQLDIY